MKKERGEHASRREKGGRKGGKKKWRMRSRGQQSSWKKEIKGPEKGGRERESWKRILPKERKKGKDSRNQLEYILQVDERKLRRKESDSLSRQKKEKGGGVNACVPSDPLGV